MYIYGVHLFVKYVFDLENKTWHGYDFLLEDNHLTTLHRRPRKLQINVSFLRCCTIVEYWPLVRNRSSLYIHI